MVSQLLSAHAGLRNDMDSLRQALTLLTQRSTATAAEVHALVDNLAMRQNAWQLKSFCDFYCRTLETHHSIEDFRIFPAVLRAAPELTPVVAKLEADHRRIGTLLNAVTDAVASLSGDDPLWATAHSAVGTLADHLEEHLTLEEEHIIPVLGRLPAWV
ncbi:hemerythrin domain-containing protein [Streptomyces sp. NPDC093109]|uniref:hemerythrin domain-containing protein n=1 Tax=Streptomyces sp. NPDC093109 TaxID=3154977 RepID=UPI00344D63A2